MEHVEHLTVEGVGGLDLAVYASGPPGGPPVVLLHGYPDNHATWDPVCAQLERTHRVIRFDNRGAGASAAPAQRSGYRVEILAGDVERVARTLSPGRRVHLVGHDWGSVLGWEAATEPGAQDWLASWTPISGPCLDHVAAWTRDVLRHPRAGGLGPMLGQQVKSAYVGLFLTPWLPELAWRHVLVPRWEQRLARTEHVRRPASPMLERDAVNGLELYRANVVRRAGREPRARHAQVEVQLVVAGRDSYVSPAMAMTGLRWAEPAWLRTLDTGHWGTLLTHAPQLAAWVTEFVAHIEAGVESPDLVAARAAARAHSRIDQV